MTGRTPHLWRRALGAAALCVVAAASGCGRAGPPVGVVRGEVTLDGVPLPDGHVTLFAADDGAPPVTADVSAGRFTATVRVGRYRVVVRSPELPPGAAEGAYARERVPVRYNTQSELRIDVAAGENAARYDLRSR